MAKQPSYDSPPVEEAKVYTANRWECELRVMEAAQAWRDNANEKTAEALRNAVDVLRDSKFAKWFWTPYEQYKSRIGSPFTVIGAATRDEEGTLLYRIRFDSDKHVVMAFAEEVVTAAQVECHERNPGLDRPVPEGVFA